MNQPARRWLVLTAVALAASVVRPRAQQAPPIQLFFEAASADSKKAVPALDAIGQHWRNGYASLVVDLARFLIAARPDAGANPFEQQLPVPDELARRASPTLPDPSALPAVPSQARARLVRFLEQRTGQRFGDDLGKWREWMWRLPYDPHPDAMRFKAILYSMIDPRMGRFFAGPSLIRLDEIDWGGVKVNGIPPLVAPEAIPAARATYLDDRHVVFGVVAGGRPRAYPRRILAWHEMAHDTLGGVRLTLVYCTLCGTVIPYLSDIDGTHRTFGTSGLLYRSNKLMFDEESGSLWSTLEGKPVVGPLAGGTARLSFLPVVTTTWGEWRRAHPDTTVLSIATGFERDYSEGAAYRDYFATDRLMFRVPAIDTRLKNKDEILGLLLPARGGGRQAVAFSTAFLQRHRIYHATFEGRNVVVVTSPKGANRIFDAGTHAFTPGDADDRLVDAHGKIWRVSEDALTEEGAGTRLARIPAFRAFWFGWFAQFPETELVK